MFNRIIIAIIVTLFLFSNVVAVLEKTSYDLGENVEINLEGIINYQVKIVTPSQNYLMKGSDDSFVFKPEEIGKYSVIVSYSDNEDIYEFEVYGELSESDSGETTETDSIVEVEESEFEEEQGVKQESRIESWDGPVINRPVRNEIREELGEKGNIKVKIPSVADNVTVFRETADGREEIPAEVKVSLLEEMFKRAVTLGQVGAKASVEVEGAEGNLEIEFYTPGPVAEEKVISEMKKEVVISSVEEVHYENVLAYSDLPEFTDDERAIKVYWKERGENIDFEVFDKDGDGLFDYIEWVVPHLSEQTFEIIVIIKAEHLDENKNFLKDVYEEVSEQDGIWQTVAEGHYLRVTFERFLNSRNDITVYARSNSSGRIEVYEVDGSDLLATFEISGQGWYKIYLDKLVGNQETFDMKFSGEVEVDYIVDPTYFDRVFYEGWESGVGGWTEGTDDAYIDNTRSRCTDSGAVGGSWSWLLRDNTGQSYIHQNFDFRGYDNITLTFSSYFTSIEGNEYLSILCDNTVIWTYEANGNEDVWLDGLGDNQRLTIYPENCTAFDESTRIRFEAEFGTDDDQVWIDCINLTGGYYYDPTQVVDAEGISIAPLSNTTFAMAWCDERNDYVTFAVYNTTGSLITGPRVADGSIGTCNAYGDEVSVSAFNSSVFVVAWVDDQSDDVTFRTFTTNGNEITSGPVYVDSAAGGDGKAVSVSALNSTTFVIGWIDDADQDAKFAVYDYRGNAIGSEVIVDSATGGGSYAVSVSAFNSTAFVIGWFHNQDSNNDARARTYSVGGTAISSELEVDNNAGASRSVRVSAFNSTAFVLAWFDANSNDVSFRTYSISGTEITSGEVDVDTDSIDVFAPYSVSVSALNSSAFVIGWYDDDSKDHSFAVYSAGGTQLVGKTNAIAHTSPKSYATQTVASYSAATGIGFCNINFIMAYGRTDVSLEWDTFKSTGWYWNGLCSGANPPYVINARINETSKLDKNSFVRVNASVFAGDNPISRVFLEVDPPISASYNTTLANSGDQYFNDSIFLNEFGKWRFTYYANDTSNNRAVPVSAEDGEGNFFIDVSYANKFNSLVALDAIAISPLDLDKYVVGWCDERDNFGTFAVYETDGDLLSGPSTVDLSLGGCSGYGNEISTAAFNGSNFVVAWIDDASDVVRFRSYTKEGSELTSGSVTVDYVGGGGKAMSVAALNSTDFIVGYIDDSLQDARFSVYNYRGNPRTFNITADDTVGGASYGVYVSAFNESSFVIGWHDDASGTLSFRTYQVNGSAISAETIVNATPGEARSFELAVVNSTVFAIAWYETSTDNVKARVYDINGNPVTGEVIVDTDATGTSPQPYSVSVTRVNSTVFAVGWVDDETIETKVRWYNSDGSALNSEVVAESEVMVYSYAPQQVASSVHSTNLHICEDNLLFGYATTDITDYVVGYYPNGTIWDGICTPSPAITINSPIGTVADVTPVLNVTLSGTAANLWYNINGGPNQIWCTNCGGEQTKVLYLVEGNYTVNVYANISTGMQSTNSSDFQVYFNNNYFDSYDDNSSIILYNNVYWGTGNVTFRGIGKSITYSPGSAQVNGSWNGTYGRNGVILDGWASGSGSAWNTNYDSKNLSNITSYSFTGNVYTWSSSTTDVRAARNITGTTRRATCSYAPSGSLTMQLTTNLNDYNLTFYILDWDTTSRRQNITVSSLDGTYSASHNANYNFNGGRFVTFEIHGISSIQTTFALVAGTNTVVSGVFLDEIPPINGGDKGNFTIYSANLTSNISLITNVSWLEHNTNAGNNITIQVSPNNGVNWYTATNGLGINSIVGGNSLVYRALFASSEFRNFSLLDVNISWSGPVVVAPPPNVTIISPNEGDTLADVTPTLTVSIDGTANSLYYTTNNGATNMTICTSCTAGTYSKFMYLREGNFNAKVYATNSLGNASSANVSITVDMNKNYYDTFNDNSSLWTINYVNWGTGNVSFTGSNKSMSYVNGSSQVGGSWKGVYGGEGAILTGWAGGSSTSWDVTDDSRNLSRINSYTILSGSAYTWSSSTSESRAVENITGTLRRATCVYNGGSFSFRLNLSISDYNLTFYFLDWDRTGRTQDINISDITGNYRAGRYVSSFGDGVYVTFEVKGINYVNVTITQRGPTNAVLSGIFVDEIEGANSGNFISYPVNTTSSIKSISNITWKEDGTDAGNTISVQLSANNGVNWTNAIKGQGLTNITSGASMVYRVLFGTNSSKTISLLDMNITWTEPPDLNIFYPVDGFRYNRNVSYLNYTLAVPSGVTLVNCWWSNNSGATNYTFNCNQNYTQINSTGGSNTWSVYANDSAGFTSSDTVTFIVDTTAPNLTFINQTDESGQIVNATYPLEEGQNLTIYVNVSDENVDDVWVVVWQTVKGGAEKTRVFFTYVAGILWKAVIPTNYGWNLLNYNYTIYANDTGNWNVSYDGNFSLLKMNISINITPFVSDASANVSLYGHVNLTNGTNLINHPINIYRGGVLLLLGNLTPIGSYNFYQNKTDTTTADFDLGSYYQMVSSDGNLTLTGGSSIGNYTKTLDAGARVQWTKAIWNEYLPVCDIATLSFQDGDSNSYSGTGDTRVQDNNPNNNYVSSNLAVDANNPVTRTLIRFDGIFGTGANKVPYNSTISSATISVQVYDIGDIVSVYEVLENWTESQATYNDRLTGTAWTGAGVTGASRSTTLESTFNPEDLTNYNFDITNAFRRWTNQTSENYGVVLHPGGNNNVNLRQSEYGTVSQRPQLSVTYTPSSCLAINVYVRTSNDKSSWTSWQQVSNSESITDSNLASRYLQYRVEMSTQNVSKAPHLTDISFNYTAVVTNASGDYNYNFTAPSDGGLFNINVNTFYNTIFGNASIILTVAGTPSVPILNSPANGSTITSSPVVFNWLNSTDYEGNPISYIINVDNDTDFSSPFYSNSSVPESANPTGVVVNLTADGIYYWRVRAYDGVSGNSSWSSVWQVRLDRSAPNLTFINQTDQDNLKVNATHPLEQGQNLTIYVNVSDTNVDDVWIVIWNSVVGGAEKTRVFFTYVAGILWKAVIPTNYGWDLVSYNYTIYANDTGNLTSSYEGNFSMVRLQSSFSIIPNPINITQNVTLRGSVSFTNGSSLGNYPINLYFNGNLLFLSNVTPVGSYNFNQNKTDTSTADFNSGSYYLTRSDGENLTLAVGNTSGNYTRIFDAGARVQWGSLIYQSTGAACSGIVNYQDGNSIGYSSSADTWVDANNPTSTYADDIGLTVDSNNPVARAIIRFDDLFGFGSAKIPYNSTISAANITVRIANTGSDIYVYEILQNWSESQATYNNRLTSTAWAGTGVTGASRSTVLEGIFSPTATADRTVDITNAFRRWTNQTSNNYGVVFDPSGPDNVIIRSSEYTTQAQRPRLTVGFNSSDCTNIEVYVRTSNNKVTWTSWQLVTSGQKITDNNVASRYLEYKVELKTVNASFVPRVGYVSANFTAIVTNSTGDYAYNLSSLSVFGAYPAFLNTSYRTMDTTANDTLLFQIGVNPVVTLVSPATGLWFSYGNLTLIYNASDANNDMLYSRLIINGKVNQTNTTGILNGLYNNFTVNFTSGQYNWTVNVTDLTDLQSTAATRTFYVDLESPNVSLFYPSSGSSFSAFTVNLSFIATDNLDPILSCDIRLDGTNIFSGISATNGATTNRTTGTLSGGIHFWNVTCRDEVLRSFTSETWNFTISNLPPTVSLVSPSVGYLDGDGNVSFVFNASDDGGFLNCTLYINDTFYSINQSAINNGFNSTINATGLSEGNKNWTVECFDTTGESARPSVRTFSVDLYYPSIQLNLPANNSVVSTSNVIFNFTANDSFDTVLDCNFGLDSGIDTFTATSGVLTNRLKGNLTDGIHTWNVQCSDNALHSNVSETRYVNISEPPRVYLNTSNATSINVSSIYLNYTAFDNSNLSSCSLYLNGQFNQSNSSAIVNGQVGYFFVEGLSSGLYNWYVNCTDVVGLVSNSTTRIFYVDNAGPDITLYYPNGQNVFFANISFNFSVVDSIDTTFVCNLSVDDDPVVLNIAANNGSVVQRNVSGITDGYHNWSVSCLDDAGNIGRSLVYNFTKLTVPDVTLIFPVTGYWFNVSSFNLTYVPDDDQGILNSSLIINGEVNLTNTSEIANHDYNNFSIVAFPDGIYNWTVSVTDITGLVGTALSRIFYVDTNNPSLVLNQPNGSFFVDTNNVSFNFSVADNLDELLDCNLTLNGGVEFEGLVANGTDKLVYIPIGDGNYTWYVNCVDNASNVNVSQEINFTIEAPPNVTLDSPAAGYWSNRTNLTFIYTPFDAIRIDRCELYIDGVLNDTDTSIAHNVQNNFTVVNVPQGQHNWTVNCFDADENSYSPPARIFYVDIQFPVVTLLVPLNQTNVLRATKFNFSAEDNLADTLNCSLFIDGVRNGSAVYLANGSMSERNVSVLSLGLHSWNVSCIDNASNLAWSSTWQFNVTLADLMINGSEIVFNSTNPLENETVIINATVHNLVNVTVPNVIVSFFDGNPFAGGRQIGANQTISSISGFGQVTVSVQWLADLGTSSIFVHVDPPTNLNGSIEEWNENNNVANKTNTVEGWHFLVGEVDSLSEFDLADSTNRSVRRWIAANYNSGNLYAADSESSISWVGLQALGQTIADADSFDDFNDTDVLLNMTNFADSVLRVYTNLTTVKNLSSYTVFKKNIDEVPSANSTNNTNFITGILWDTSDDVGDGEYSTEDGEDLVFVAPIRRDLPGAYGTYDYEIRVPASLRAYKKQEVAQVVFYAELR